MRERLHRSWTAASSPRVIFGAVGRVALAAAAVATAVAWALRLFLPMAREFAGWSALSAPEAAQLVSFLLAGR